MRKAQLANLAEQIRREGLAGMLVCPSEEMLFLTGFSPMMCERFQGLFITAAGDCFYVCNMLYSGEVEHAFGGAIPIYTWMDGESMTDIVGKALAANGLMGGKLGVNSSAQAFNVLDILRDCDISFVNGKEVLEEARIIKTNKELDSLRAAAKIADGAFAKVVDFIKPGQTEADILHFLSTEMAAAGGTDCWGIVASGPNSSYPHYMGTSRVIQQKDMMILDFGCAVDGLFSDMSRTVFVGGISDEERKIYEIVRRANQAGEDAAVNGAFVPDVDAAARSIIGAEGYGETFINRLGHGIGYMLHEAPYIKKDNCRKLEPGMAFSVEPGIYISGKLGMRVEDIVIVTEQGNEILNKASREIIVV